MRILFLLLFYYFFNIAEGFFEFKSFEPLKFRKLKEMFSPPKSSFVRKYQSIIPSKFLEEEKLSNAAAKSLFKAKKTVLLPGEGDNVFSWPLFKTKAGINKMFLMRVESGVGGGNPNSVGEQSMGERLQNSNFLYGSRYDSADVKVLMKRDVDGSFKVINDFGSGSLGHKILSVPSSQYLKDKSFTGVPMQPGIGPILNADELAQTLESATKNFNHYRNFDDSVMPNSMTSQVIPESIQDLRKKYQNPELYKADNPEIVRPKPITPIPKGEDPILTGDALAAVLESVKSQQPISNIKRLYFDTNDLSALQSLRSYKFSASAFEKMDIRKRNEILENVGKNYSPLKTFQKLRAGELDVMDNRVRGRAGAILRGEQITPDYLIQSIRANPEAFGAADLFIPKPKTVLSKGQYDTLLRKMTLSRTLVKPRQVLDLINDVNVKKAFRRTPVVVVDMEMGHALGVQTNINAVNPNGKTTINLDDRSMPSNSIISQSVTSSAFSNPFTIHDTSKHVTVNSAGNTGIGISNFGRLMEDRNAIDSVILVGAVKPYGDGTQIAGYTNQPLSSETAQGRFLVAPDISLKKLKFGTSYSTPLVSAALAKVIDEKKISSKEGMKLLLDNADPVLVDKLGNPYLLPEFVSSSQAEAYLLSKDLPLDDLIRGRQKYGMGKLNIARAMNVKVEIPGDKVLFPWWRKLFNYKYQPVNL